MTRCTNTLRNRFFVPRWRVTRKPLQANMRSATDGHPCGSDAMPRKWGRYLAEHVADAAAAGLRMSPARRLLWLKIVTVIAFCAGLALSPHLWIGPRSYPLAPVLAVLPPDGGAAQALYAALFVLAAAIILAPRPRILIAAFAAIVALFCLADQTRWQPWV